MKPIDWMALIAIAAYAVLRFFFWSPSAERIAEADALVYKFARTIFESEVGGKKLHIRRWEHDVVIGVAGEWSSYYLLYITDIADHLALLTGRHISVIDLGATYVPDQTFADKPTPRAPQVNFLVLLTPHAKLAETMSFIPGAKEEIEARTPMGYGTGGGTETEQTIVAVAVSDNFPEPQVLDTLLEEISQGFGPINDTEIVHPSVWSDNRPTFDRLPLNDQIVLRALYDPALTPGMPKDQAMRLVRDIIPRLVEAARQQGERALYQ